MCRISEPVFDPSPACAAAGIRARLAVCLLILAILNPLQAQTDPELALDILESLIDSLEDPEPGSAEESARVDYNPYDDSQLESLVSEAVQLQEAGNHAGALLSFERAWQVSRVLNGLYHSSQLPLLESMIVSDTELENWRAIDDRYSYLELLYNRLYDDDDIRLEVGLQKVSSWHINAFNRNLDGMRAQHLRQARNTLQRRLDVANNTLPPGHPKFDFLYESIRLSDELISLIAAGAR